MPVYNCASSERITVLMGQITDIGISIAPSTPMDQMLWVPGGRPTLNRTRNYIVTVFCHLLPAILIDAILMVKGHKTL